MRRKSSSAWKHSGVKGPRGPDGLRVAVANARLQEILHVAGISQTELKNNKEISNVHTIAAMVSLCPLTFSSRGSWSTVHWMKLAWYDTTISLAILNSDYP